jgi:hypothetical protein
VTTDSGCGWREVDAQDQALPFPAQEMQTSPVGIQDSHRDRQAQTTAFSTWNNFEASNLPRMIL